MNISLTLEEISLSQRLQPISLHLKGGQCWHLLGKNGAGKSSMLLLIANLLAPSSGRLLMNDRALSEYSLLELASQRCFLSQQQHVEFDIPLFELCQFYLQQERFPDTLEVSLSLAPFMQKPLSELSGGQRQRFHIALCLAQTWSAISQGQALILLDEPCQQLDISCQLSLLQLLEELVNKGNLLVMSSHDINQTNQFATHVALLKDQHLISAGAIMEQLNLELLKQIFDHEFMEINDSRYLKKFLVSAYNQHQ